MMERLDRTYIYGCVSGMMDVYKKWNPVKIRHMVCKIYIHIYIVYMYVVRIDVDDGIVVAHSIQFNSFFSFILSWMDGVLLWRR